MQQLPQKLLINNDYVRFLFEVHGCSAVHVFQRKVIHSKRNHQKVRTMIAPLNKTALGTGVCIGAVLILLVMVVDIRNQNVKVFISSCSAPPQLGIVEKPNTLWSSDGNDGEDMARRFMSKFDLNISRMCIYDYKYLTR